MRFNYYFSWQSRNKSPVVECIVVTTVLFRKFSAALYIKRNATAIPAKTITVHTIRQAKLFWPSFIRQVLYIQHQIWPKDKNINRYILIWNCFLVRLEIWMNFKNKKITKNHQNMFKNNHELILGDLFSIPTNFRIL